VAKTVFSSVTWQHAVKSFALARRQLGGSAAVGELGWRYSEGKASNRRREIVRSLRPLKHNIS